MLLDKIMFIAMTFLLPVIKSNIKCMTITGISDFTIIFTFKDISTGGLKILCCRVLLLGLTLLALRVAT